MKTEMTTYEKGVYQGRLATVIDQLQDRFGPLSPEVMDRLKGLPMDRLAELGRALMRAESLQELGLED